MEASRWGRRRAGSQEEALEKLRLRSLQMRLFPGGVSRPSDATKVLPVDLPNWRSPGPFFMQCWSHRLYGSWRPPGVGEVDLNPSSQCLPVITALPPSPTGPQAPGGSEPVPSPSIGTCTEALKDFH